MKIIKVKMFGKLELTYLGKTITSDNIRSDMAVILLSYILCHHEKEITMQSLCEQLWEDNESDNPIGALKNLMYRLRTSLKRIWDEEFIITTRGSYRWNPEITVSSDFERLDYILKSTTKESINIELLEEGVSLYQDAFLSKHRKHRWLIQLASYYQSQFTSLIKRISSTYLYLEEYGKLEILCNRALMFDEYDVSVHYLLLQSYIKQNKKQVAIEHYKALSKLLMDELGISVSDKIKKLYTEFLKSENYIEMDLGIIEQDLQESLRSGAFICEYGVFKEIYRLQARQISRMGMAVYCALLSVEVVLDIPTTSEMYKRLIRNAMSSIEEILLKTLRIGDTASRYSVSQYVILLPTCTYESAIIVMERLIGRYHNEKEQNKINMLYEIKEISFKTEDRYEKS